MLTAMLACGALVAAVLGPDSDGAQRSHESAASVSSGACGPRTAAVLARVDAMAARRIYESELRGHEVSVDAAHVRSWQPLLEALAGGDRAAVAAAVHQLVYMPRWHIVRLRVLVAGRTLADVGGPDVTVPVRGALVRNGTRLGSYVMSVQDDLGYEKLVTRFIGVPIDLYRGNRLLMGTLPLASPPGSGSSVTIAGRTYRAHVMHLRAFPSGTLTAALLVPADANLERASCSVVQTRAWGSIARHVAERFAPQIASHYADLADIVRSTTPGYLFVLRGGREIAGGPLPRSLPPSGRIHYLRRTWSVYSWSPAAGTHAYELTPAGRP